MKAFSYRSALGVALVAAVLLVPAAVTTATGGDRSPVASKAERKYRCTKCRQVFTFDRPGNYKCPTCNKPLIPAS